MGALPMRRRSQPKLLSDATTRCPYGPSELTRAHTLNQPPIRTYRSKQEGPRVPPDSQRNEVQDGDTPQYVPRNTFLAHRSTTTDLPNVFDTSHRQPNNATLVGPAEMKQSVIANVTPLRSTIRDGQYFAPIKPEYARLSKQRQCFSRSRTSHRCVSRSSRVVEKRQRETVARPTLTETEKPSGCPHRLRMVSLAAPRSQ